MYELEKVNRMFNSNERLKLTHEQCGDIAIMILEEFPHESLEDFAMAFRRGITGKYDEKLLRLDVQVIFRWIRMFLDEKSQRIEATYKQETQVEARTYTDEEKANIQKIINDSWVGQALREQVQDQEAYRKFKAEYLVKLEARNDKLRKRINPKSNGEN